MALLVSGQRSFFHLAPPVAVRQRPVEQLNHRIRQQIGRHRDLNAAGFGREGLADRRHGDEDGVGRHDRYGDEEREERAGAKGAAVHPRRRLTPSTRRSDSQDRGPFVGPPGMP